MVGTCRCSKEKHLDNKGCHHACNTGTELASKKFDSWRSLLKSNISISENKEHLVYVSVIPKVKFLEKSTRVITINTLGSFFITI